MESIYKINKKDFKKLAKKETKLNNENLVVVIDYHDVEYKINEYIYSLK